MKRLSFALAFLICASTYVLAGPNAGGTIIVHSASLTYEGHAECGRGTAPGSCATAVTRIDNATSDSLKVWKVYAAFPSNACPRLKDITFGLAYDDDYSDQNGIVLNSYGSCADAELDMNGWPHNQTGTTLSWNSTQRATLVECYWFAGYNYYQVPKLFQLIAHPEQGGYFADDGVPAELDAITGYGSLGFNMNGQVACPTILKDSPCDQVGACCLPHGAGTCEILSEALCAAQGGAFRGIGTVCGVLPDSCKAQFGDRGACCHKPLGMCTMEYASTCADTSSETFSSGTSCSPNYCQPMGACCEGEQCVFENAYDCAQAAGQFQGVNTECTPNPCPQTPVKVSTWGEIKNRYH